MQPSVSPQYLCLVLATFIAIVVLLLSLTELLLHLVRCGAFCINVSSFGCSSMVVFLCL